MNRVPIGVRVQSATLELSLRSNEIVVTVNQEPNSFTSC